MANEKQILEIKQNAEENKELFLKCKTKILKEHDLKMSSEWKNEKKELK